MEKAFQSAFASYSFSNLFVNLTGLAVAEINTIWEVNSQLRKLERVLLKVQEMVDTLECSRASFLVNRFSNSWIAWLEEANQLLYDVNDLLEEISLNLGFQKGDKLEVGKLITEFMLCVPRKIKGLVKELQELVKEMDTVLCFDSIKKQDPKLFMSKQCFESSSSVNQIMIGRGDQLEKVVKILAETKLPICITGMAGIGKSTFTRCLCNTEKVKTKYPLMIWVSSTAEFDLMAVMRSVIEYVSGKSCSSMNPEVLRSMLADLLPSEPFIVVLDNFDTEDFEVWHMLCDIFKVESTEQRRIIITTRNSKLSYAIGAKIFRLPTISDNNCWNIMKQRPFLDKSDNIEVVGMELGKMCCGLPSVAKTLGDMLHLLPDQEWNSILQCNLWDLPQFKNYVVPNMLFSYSCLAPHLKKCFSYLSLFPQGFEYEMSNIVQLWMAEGLIPPISGRQIEEVGKEYFKELIFQSFFYSQNEDPNDCSVLYKMHDWNHHMALVVSSGLCILSEDKESFHSPDSVRHLSMHHGDSRSVDLQKFSKSDKLRTFIWLCPNGVYIGRNVSVLFENFKLLRVLDLESSGITEVPDSISNFKHLRYLNLANNSIRILPESICKLSHLLVLILTNCRLVSCLPENFCRLNELHHFYFDTKSQIRRMPKNIKFLVKLQSLSAFIVAAGEGRKIEELKHLSLLSGSICITGLEHVTSQEQAAAAFLQDKQGLKKLELEWRTSLVVNMQEDVLAGLQPNRNVEELIISNYSGKRFPTWILDSQSCRLRRIHLRRCQRCHTFPLLGNLQFLEHLIIECMSLLESVCQDSVEFGDFPALKYLWFVQMPQLANWGRLGFHCMRQLRDLMFNDCPKLVDAPTVVRLTNLQNLEFSGCEKLDYLRCLPASVDTLIIQDCPRLKTLCQVDGIQWDQVSRYSGLLLGAPVILYEIIAFVLPGLSFQVPVIQLLLGQTGLVSGDQILSIWRYVVVGAVLAAAVLTPSTDPLTQVLQAGPLLGLYLWSTDG